MAVTVVMHLFRSGRATRCMYMLIVHSKVHVMNYGRKEHHCSVTGKYTMTKSRVVYVINQPGGQRVITAMKEE